MATTIGAYQAKTNFAQLIERAAKGERITITKYGVPVVVMSPVEVKPARPISEVIEDLKTFRRSLRLEDNLREIIEEGRA
ncbi:MAG: type II toxin-antitoxin system prevent-host-death family antitoxin [Candidatus Gerdarchaeota archaeon]|nr:MAG: prevent-host-death protein [Anaerolinea sp. 4484_236]RLI67745.1 MAG: type II toxin-antitoxin system prevent-host-death family antitoxin [Candidatus Gerdarchaeota archaeon]